MGISVSFSGFWGLAVPQQFLCQLVHIIGMFLKAAELGRGISSRTLSAGRLPGRSLLLGIGRIQGVHVSKRMYIVAAPVFQNFVRVFKTGLVNGGNRAVAGFQ